MTLCVGGPFLSCSVLYFVHVPCTIRHSEQRPNLWVPMRTKEHRILDAAVKALKRTTGLDAQIHAATGGPDRAADVIFELAADRRKHRFQAEVKAVDRF